MTPPDARDAAPAGPARPGAVRASGSRPQGPLRSLGRDLGLGLLLCILLVLLILFASGPSGETQGFIYVDF